MLPPSLLPETRVPPVAATLEIRSPEQFGNARKRAVVSREGISRDVGLWLRAVFCEGAAAELTDEMTGLLDRLSLDAPALPRADADHAFRRELEALIPHLRAFSRSLTRDADAADDLLQETLEKAWAARRRFQPGTSLRAWTFVILRNQFISHLRRRRIRLVSDEATELRRLAIPPAQEGALELSEVYGALDLVPPLQREAVLLVVVGGLAYEEAAAICGCPVGTIKSRVSRARVSLHAALACTNHPVRTGGAIGSVLERVVTEADALERARRSARPDPARASKSEILTTLTSEGGT